MEINDALDIAMEMERKETIERRKDREARRVLSTRGLRDVAGEA
jgi:hypothetical protein